MPGCFALDWDFRGASPDEAGSESSVGDFDAAVPPRDSTVPDRNTPDATNPPTDSRPPGDSGSLDTSVPPPDGGTGAINCGVGLTCPLNQACCGVYQPTLRYQCAATASACLSPSTTITCDSPADCPTGQVCCGVRRQIGGQTLYESVMCTTTCSDLRFCDPAEVPTTCRAGEACRASSLLPGFSTCSN